MTLLESEIITEQVEDDDDDPRVQHLVCHCTNDNVAACGKNVAEVEWVTEETYHEGLTCVLCMVAWPDDAPRCPWGCACSEECATWGETVA